MVSTRHHPQEFPAPPKQTSARASPSPTQPTTTTTTTTTSPQRRSDAPPSAWSHTPSNLTLLWLLVSLPLVIWDTLYVLLRPHTMPGGALHSPIWVPYALYGSVDYTYGWPAWHAHNGFAAAQGTLNAIETVGYAVYLALVWRYGRSVGAEGRGAPSKKVLGGLAEARVLSGRGAGWALLVGYGTAVMTVSKTVLYWLNEYFSEFENIGHNDAYSLIFLWIIPNGLWLVVPSYMVYVFGSEILEAIEVASGGHQKKQQ